MKVKINFLFYIVALIFIITGMFRPFVWIFSLIIVHEIGHILTGIFLKWKIDKVIITAFGCVTVFKEYLNRSIKEELLIAIMGPIFQIMYFLIINKIVNYDWFYAANISLLLFNLLPIIPLDGSKIIHSILDIFLTFKLSHNTVIIISFILTILIGITCIINHNLLLIIAFICLLIKVINEYNEKELRFQKYLLERYLYSFVFKKTIKIDNIKKMKRNKNHLIYFKNKWTSEKKYLKEHFKMK